MAIKKTILLTLLISIVSTGIIAQNFIGKPGFYYKGRFDVPTPNNAYTIPYVDGIIILASWHKIEPSQGVFDWSYIDSEIVKAKNNNKDVAIGIISPPNWIHDSLNAPVYYYKKKNLWSPRNGDTLMGYITWDSIYLNRLDTLTKHLATKYANDTAIKYFNLVSALITRGFPDSVVTTTGMATFWTEFNYHADTILPHLKHNLDRYMTLFPNTPLWNSIDYVKFERRASGNFSNFLTSKYVDYGVLNYPDRFGLWKEDLSACIYTWGLQNPGSTWFTMAKQSCRHGSQMLWHVQDGPSRMNQCNIAPKDSSSTSKIAVMDSTFALGMSMGMRYYEIYPGDLSDTSLQNTFIKWHNILDTTCKSITSIPKIKDYSNVITIYPNPTKGFLKIASKTEYKDLTISIFNILGEKIESFSNKTEIDISHLSIGTYYLKIKIDNKVEVKKVMMIE